jgi:mycofactocin biosynthetic radical S-adenosylmethionine protein MftC
MSVTNYQRLPLVLIPQHFGSLVFDRRTSRYYPFDHLTTFFLSALKSEGFNDALRRVDAFLPTTNESERNERREALWQFFDYFTERGFFDLHGRFAGECLPLTPPADHLTGPLAVHLELVAACNLTCTHCFAGQLPRKAKPLTHAELDRLFGEMAAMGSFRLGLTGGELLMRKDLFEVLDMATGHGLHPCVTTNGLLITEEIAREFGKRELVWLNVSLEGATAATNDRVRGAGVFDAVLEKLQILGKYARFTLAFTLMRTNVGEVEACAELARRVGAHTAVFRPLYPVGTSRAHLDELMPSFEEYSTALARLAAAGAIIGQEDGNNRNKPQPSEGYEVCGIEPFNPHTRQAAQGSIYTGYGCAAANTVCSISGSLRHHSFADIWHTSVGFRRMRSLPGGTPDTFSGGCRARALVLSGSENAPDPWLQNYAGGGSSSKQPLPLVRKNTKPTAGHPSVTLELERPVHAPLNKESCQ